MHSPKHLSLAGLVSLGLLFCATNVAVTLQRTMIPRSLEGRVTSLKTMREKHPGLDDVLLLAIENQRPFQTERGLFLKLSANDHVQKDSWSRSVTINGARSTIPWSADFIGMIRLMPVLLIGLMLLAYLSVRTEPRQSTLPTR